ncbi:MAG: DUF5055 domain-containing protein [Succinivibrionaceae bacterium]|nr:DUF5055 domain-containing protein [Succinivibrionaceae bacterium]
MSKTLSVTYENKTYLLEYTRESVRMMEQTGFVADDLFVKPMLLLPQLFYGAFFAHHRGIKRKLVEEIFNTITDRGELIGKLVEMYREPIAALTDEPEETEGNASWTASW